MDESAKAVTDPADRVKERYSFEKSRENDTSFDAERTTKSRVGKNEAKHSISDCEKATDENKKERWTKA